MVACSRVTVEGGVEIFESLGLFGCKGEGIDKNEACESGVQEGEYVCEGKIRGGAELISGCYGCRAKV